MGDHPPVQQGSLGKRARPWRAIVIIVCAVLVVVAGWLWLSRPAKVEAQWPTVMPDPRGMLVQFDVGRWTKAVIDVNDTFTCDVGELGPGETIILWNRFQGTTSAALNATMCSTIVIRGEVDGEPKAISYTVTPGAGFVAVSSTSRESVPEAR